MDETSASTSDAATSDGFAEDVPGHSLTALSRSTGLYPLEDVEERSAANPVSRSRY